MKNTGFAEKAKKPRYIVADCQILTELRSKIFGTDIIEISSMKKLMIRRRSVDKLLSFIKTLDDMIKTPEIDTGITRIV